ncbi:methylenetetrahydrofolate reductase [Desulfohalovibrio reitneri]|uniref:methylenetetrahydrofolate reductase n=1 Tax=Desulfohalovibrio reitneri TaxID=1307759 RepID=UPI0004A6B611|nr:methylenetetrahydrofolate reductase [Desulfohalovibrio reitneri]
MRITEQMNQRKPFVSLEFFPPKEREAWPDFFKEADKLKAAKPLFASVTYGAGGSTQDNTLEIASRLKAQTGFEPLVHLTTVGASEKKIGDFLNQLRDNDLDNVLALRGDPPRGMTDFKPDNERFQHATDLIDFVRQRHPDMGLGAATYPEAHPQSPSFAKDLYWSKVKAERGAGFFITQLFFDPRLYFDHVERLKGMGVDVPVVPGVLPIMSLQSIRFILTMCGASIPGKFYLELEEAHEKGGNAAVRELGIRFATEQSRRLIEGGAPGVHLYTLNKADACLEIVDNLNLA